MQQAFVDAGYDASFGRVTVSNRPDLCEYQCNGALSAAKQYKCAPIQIANAVVAQLDAGDYDLVEAVMPGFINLKLSGAFLQNYLEAMRTAPSLACTAPSSLTRVPSGKIPTFSPPRMYFITARTAEISAPSRSTPKPPS